MTIVEAEPVRDTTVGWELWGARLGGGHGPTPRLRTKLNCDWDANELTNGIANIRVDVPGDDPHAVVLTVLGVNPVTVHDTWHRVMEALQGTTYPWFGEEVPF
jgi:hypothetical protein